MKPLIVGEAPSKNEYPPTPIEGRIGKRLASYAGITFEEFLTHFERMNLIEERQDNAEKGFTFDYHAAVKRGQTLLPQIQPGQIVLLLGKRVAGALGVTKDYFEPHYLENGALLYVLPHPSGVNRWHNDPKNAYRMTCFMHSLVEVTR